MDAVRLSRALETPPAASNTAVHAATAASSPVPAGAGAADDRWAWPGCCPASSSPETWATRDFTLTTRLLSEARIIVDYIVWTLLPTPDALSFYHDNFHISTGLLTPWTTLASIVLLGALIALMLWLRRRLPLAALGIALFLGCQLLTGTILPLELIYEHRNYFASFGLLLAIVPCCSPHHASQPFALPRHCAAGRLMLCWTGLTAFTAYAWGNPLRLAEDLASARHNRHARSTNWAAPTSSTRTTTRPRLSPNWPMRHWKDPPRCPMSSILPEQALIFMNSRMHLPLKDAWWDSMIAKLKAQPTRRTGRKLAGCLTQCAREHHCDLPKIA